MTQFDEIIGVAAMVGGIVLFVMFLHASHKNRMRRLASERSPVSLDEFVRHFSSQDVPNEVVLAVYQGVAREFACIPDFPIAPSDDLRDVYDADDELISAVIEDLLTDCGRTWPPLDEVESVDGTRTVEDLVRLLASYPSAARINIGGQSADVAQHYASNSTAS